MSAPYKKDFRQIKNASKYLHASVFSKNPDLFMFGANLNFFDENSEEAEEIFDFLEDASAALWHHFDLYVGGQSSRNSTINYVSEQYQQPRLRTKKRRALKHAEIVIMSQMSRQAKRLREKKYQNRFHQNKLSKIDPSVFDYTPRVDNDSPF